MVLPRTESNSTEELPANIAYFGVRLAPARARHSSVAGDLWGQQIQQSWTPYLNQFVMRNLIFLYNWGFSRAFKNTSQVFFGRFSVTYLTVDLFYDFQDWFLGNQLYRNFYTVLIL